MLTKISQLAPLLSPLRNIHPPRNVKALLAAVHWTFIVFYRYKFKLSTIKFDRMHERGRACARSGQQRVRRSTASKMSGSGEESTTHGDVGRPFPDIVK